MNIRETIMQDFRKPNMLVVMDWIGNNPTRFKELMAMFMDNEYRVVQRSAWVLSLVVDRHPGLVMPYLSVMVDRMQEEGHEPAVRRNIVRILQFVDLPEDLHGIVMDTCFRFASNPKEEIAVRCCSLIVLSRLAKIYPEIVAELQAVIEEGLEHGATPAFKASSKKALKALKLGKGGM